MVISSTSFGSAPEFADTPDDDDDGGDGDGDDDDDDMTGGQVASSSSATEVSPAPRWAERPVLAPTRRSPSPLPTAPVFSVIMANPTAQNPLDNMFRQQNNNSMFLGLPDYVARPGANSMESEDNYPAPGEIRRLPSSPGPFAHMGDGMDDDYEFQNLSMIGVERSDSSDSLFSTKRKTSDVVTHRPMKVTRRVPGAGARGEEHSHPSPHPHLFPHPRMPQYSHHASFEDEGDFTQVAGGSMSPNLSTYSSSASYLTSPSVPSPSAPCSAATTPNVRDILLPVTDPPFPAAPVSGPGGPRRRHSPYLSEEEGQSEDEDEDQAGRGTQSMEERRQVHIMSEKKRRSNINHGFEGLRAIMPFADIQKASKSKLLHLTLEHLRSLRETRQELAEELEWHRQNRHQANLYVLSHKHTFFLCDLLNCLFLLLLLLLVALLLG